MLCYADGLVLVPLGGGRVQALAPDTLATAWLSDWLPESHGWAGFFAPQNADGALTVLGMMEFEGKDQIMQKIAENGTMAQQLKMYQQMALALAKEYRPDLAEGLAQSMGAAAPASARGNVESAQLEEKAPQENRRVQAARQRSAEASQPQG